MKNACVAWVLLLWGCANGGPEDFGVPRDRALVPDAATDAVIPVVRAPDAGLPPSEPAPSDETCDDGRDDDLDAKIDEGCACVPGTTQSCYPGDPSRIDVGTCRSGTQGCEGAGEFGTWSSCVGAVEPETDVCLDGIDQDCNGTADDDASCVCAPGDTQECFDGPPLSLGAGICRPGTATCFAEGGVLGYGDCLDQVLPRPEICGNGLDDDCNGAVDDAPGCECTTGTNRVCYSGPMSEIGVGVCRAGMQSCLAGGRWDTCRGEVGPSTEICGNDLDDDCNGMVDEGCPTIIEVPININGDCVTASCPLEAPFPVGCAITLYGGDPRGCVGSLPFSPVVYFQEGDACGAGLVQGTLRCSSEVGLPLNALSCPINKPDARYAAGRGGCPATSG